MSSSTVANVASLFNAATDDGTLTPASVMALNIPDIGANIAAGLGVAVDDVTASEVVLVTMLIDDSGSIRFGKNADAVRAGHNLVIDALKDSKQGDGIIAHTRYLNGTILYPYSPLSGVPTMDTSNYDPMGMTPLYDETAVILATVLAKAQEFEDNGVPCRTVTLIITDGADCTSRRQTPAKIKKVVSDMLAAETHIVAAMGIDDGSTDFTAVFRSMGLEDEWILTPSGTPTEIRAAFNVFSRSAVRASQTAAAFSTTAAGGFIS